MGKYIIKRIGYMLVTLFIIVTITFFLMHMLPGKSLSTMDRKAAEQTNVNHQQKYGLEKPIYSQYVSFLKNTILRADLGESIRYPGRPVGRTIRDHGLVSAKLAIATIAFSLSIAIVLGLITASKRKRWQANLTRLLSVLAISIPSFILAIILQNNLASKLKIGSISGWTSLKDYILPVLVLSLGSIAVYARYVHSSVLDLMDQDFILTAKAKGLSSFNLIRKHILRNAFIPITTVVGTQLVLLFTGTFIVEKIFAIPGLGSYYISSIVDRDYPMIIGITIFYALVFMLLQLAIDIVYLILDPRIKLIENDQIGG